MTDILLHALLLSFILLGIHAYFGLEIVKRGIIFTDIAIAQSSAVGLALSLLLFQTPSYFISLLFALLCSLLIALSQRKKEYAEAFIGLLYALGFSSVVLLLSKSPRGMEEFMALTASDILFVPKEEIFKTGVLYALFGLLLYLRARFLSGIAKEMAFFALFSLTVTSSVKLVGVLIVFSMLVAPALVARLFGRGLIFAWVYGSAVNIAGIVLSFKYDLPTGFSLVFLHSFLSILLFLAKVLI
ncbi:ABC-3 protein [Hydrogenobacter thermophilus TK-6]|uniref:Metal ion ABC transporter permease n=1 Tax=Hydrogenobacter thermophilus (strain DSM 6534 / IAM 12695 / TK-6) TaxID=608538 RepID=D3DJ51_HYDTT|nr:metal ABC transporter permease [Hydrogenobacter thermophilus]ADO45777.1 ABC-3 protein [Hydrogenobacter thermophilus TK-6]BAI69853.1 metal ion ABC transporter permease [Hydrogenobacter thermophilus TK-6]